MRGRGITTAYFKRRAKSADRTRWAVGAENADLFGHFMAAVRFAELLITAHVDLLTPRRQAARQAATAIAATVSAGSGTTVIAPVNQLDPSVS